MAHEIEPHGSEAKDKVSVTKRFHHGRAIYIYIHTRDISTTPTSTAAVRREQRRSRHTDCELLLFFGTMMAWEASAAIYIHCLGTKRCRYLAQMFWGEGGALRVCRKGHRKEATVFSDALSVHKMRVHSVAKTSDITRLEPAESLPRAYRLWNWILRGQLGARRKLSSSSLPGNVPSL